MNKKTESISTLSSADRAFLLRTIELAQRGGEAVRPNPKVGAVIARRANPPETGYAEMRVLGEGWHAVYGGPHAETVALEAAREAAGAAAVRGATLYCSLEPCSFTAPDKHQPPCTRAIIASGIARVVIGMIDPNPRVSGNGVAQLRAAGIEVCLSDFAHEFEEMNREFVESMRRK